MRDIVGSRSCWGWLAAAMMVALGAAAEPLGPEDLARIIPYSQYWELVGVPASQSAAVQERLAVAIRQAQGEFAARGSALAQHFLTHIQARPSNTAYFFLFRAVGDVETAVTLIRALTDAPVPQGMAMGRDPGEIQIALEAALWNDSVRTSPSVVAALEDTVGRSRARLGYTRVAVIAVALLGRCRSAEATRFLERMAADTDPQIRAAALASLGVSSESTAGQALARAVTNDRDAEVRARAAETLGRGEPSQSAAILRESLARETDLRVIDETVRALIALRALPRNPRTCLETAARCWEASIAQPLFDCWRAEANRDDLLAQATSGSWTVRTLALDAVAKGLRARTSLLAPGAGAPLAIDAGMRDRLLRSAVEVLSQQLSGAPAPNTLSYSTAQLARDALWEISGRNMSLALAFADRIVPLSGHSISTGRFGESYDLAAKDPQAYAALRHPTQLLAAGLAALLISTLLAARRTRRIGAALLVAMAVWGVWSLSETDVRELPPPPLGYLTVSSLAFLSGGLATGCITGTRLPGWLKVGGATVLSGISAFAVCGFTRAVSWFPIGSEGWQLIFDPLGSVVLAVPFALLLSLVFVRWKPGIPAQGS